MQKKFVMQYKRIAPKIQGIIYSEYFTFLLLLLLGAFFRFKGLNNQSLWFDELLSVIRTAPDRSIFDILSTFQNDPHPPGFFMTLHFWTSIFGYNEVIARIFPAIIGSFSVVSVYWLGKECLNRRTGLIASVFISLNYYHIYYSQEVRPYIALFLFTTLSYTWFLKLIRKPNRKHAILYGMFTALMMYSHYYGLIHILAQLIFLLYYFIFEQEISYRDLIKQFALSGLIISVLYSPWIPTTLKMFAKKKHWNPIPGKDFFIDLFKRFFGYEPFLIFLFTGLLLLLLFYFLTLRQPKQLSTPDAITKTDDDNSLKLQLTIPALFSWIFFTLFIPYFRSLVTIPMYFHKYGIGTLPALIVLIAMSVSLYKNKTFRMLLITAIILVSMVNLFLHMKHYTLHRKQNWRGIAQHVIKQTNEKYNDKQVFWLTRHSKQYEFYFNSLNPSTSNLTLLPRNWVEFKTVLNRYMREGKKIGIWVIPGHRYKPSSNKLAFLDKYFQRVEKKKFGMGELMFYETRGKKSMSDNTEL
jgi:4-amino-4-deoxy-L-arabinose transferase-like glycosyltransferase